MRILCLVWLTSLWSISYALLPCFACLHQSWIRPLQRQWLAFAVDQWKLDWSDLSPESTIKQSAKLWTILCIFTTSILKHMYVNCFQGKPYLSFLSPSYLLKCLVIFKLPQQWTCFSWYSTQINKKFPSC